MKFIPLTALIVLGTYAQAQDAGTGNKPMPVSPPGVSMQHSSEGQPVHDDAQIAAIVKTANDADINGGKFAEPKAKRSDVKSYAKEMIKDHSAANAKLEKIAKKDKITETENDTSRGMKQMADKTEEHLKSVKPEDFDREYMDSELSMHQQVLDSLDNNLIPSAKNEDLKALLKDVRKTVSEHLAKAKKISTAITSHQ